MTAKKQATHGAALDAALAKAKQAAREARAEVRRLTADLATTRRHADEQVAEANREALAEREARQTAEAALALYLRQRTEAPATVGQRARGGR